MKERTSKGIIDSKIINKNAVANKKIQLITTTAIFAALITITTAYMIHIPVPVTGGYIHVGDGIIYIAAAILPTPYAISAAVIGAGMADLLTAPMWVIPTIIIKALITLAFSNKGMKIVSARNMLATLIALVISSLGYYFASTVIFGYEIAFVTSLFGSLVQSVGSAIVFLVIGMALDNMKIKRRFDI